MFKTLNLSTQEIGNSAYSGVAASYESPVCGLAYDEATDALLVTADGQVLRAEPGKDFEAVATLPAMTLPAETIAFVLQDGRYALLGEEFYIRSTAAVLEAPKALHLVGCMDTAILKSFLADNGGVSVSFDTDILFADQIASLLLTQDSTADIYATWADSTFREIVKKGYTADLSTSQALTDSALAMYPNMKSALCDDAGNPVAYPYMFILGNWQVNITLWKELFGDTPLPTTYGQFADAMLLFEQEYDDEYPDVHIEGKFDYTQWVRAFVNAYAQQYGSEDQPLSLQSDALRSVLKTLEQVRQIRLQKGKEIENVDGGFAGGTDLFVTAGHYVLQNPVDEELLSLSYEENPEGAYVDLPTLTFVEGEEQRLPGQMLVWFVNPYSKNKELAIRYLEAAARPENNLRVYYGTHPSATEPVLEDKYEAKHESLTAQLAELNAGLSAAETEEAKAAIEKKITKAEEKLATLEKSKWKISPEAIESHQAIAPQIHFFEDNPYVMRVGSSSNALDQVLTIYQRYTEGSLTLDAFLDELESRMNMLYLESN